MPLIKNLTSALLSDVDSDGKERLEKYISIKVELTKSAEETHKVSIIDSKLETVNHREYPRYQYPFTGAATAMGPYLYFNYVLPRSFPWLNNNDTFTLTYRIMGEEKVRTECFVFTDDEWKPK